MARKAIDSAESGSGSIAKPSKYTSKNVRDLEKLIEETKTRNVSRITQAEYSNLTKQYDFVCTMNGRYTKALLSGVMNPEERVFYMKYKQIEAQLEMLTLGLQDKVTEPVSTDMIMAVLSNLPTAKDKLVAPPIQDEQHHQVNEPIVENILLAIKQATRQAYQSIPKDVEKQSDQNLRARIKSAYTSYDADPSEEHLTNIVKIMQETSEDGKLHACAKVFKKELRAYPAVLEQVKEISQKLVEEQSDSNHTQMNL